MRELGLGAVPGERSAINRHPG